MDDFGGRLSKVERTVLTHGETLKEHNKRISNVEDISETISDVKDIALKILRYVKIAGPSIVSAAVAAGIVNGKLGAFFHALLGG